MLRYFKNSVRSPLFWGVFALILLLIFSLSLRQQDFKNVTGARNLEATYHVLLTVTALNESPAENHWYLPSVSLGREADKHIPWGATVPTKTGDYIYTSFTPAGFLAPYFWFKAFDLEPSLKNLARFNFFLGCASVFTLFYLLVCLLKFNGYGQWISVGAALVGSTIGIFSSEALRSHGVIYWSQSLYQTILIFSLYFLFRWLTSETKLSRRLYLVAIIVLAIVGALTEWSGYIFNCGLICILWLKRLDSAVHSKALAINIFIATAIAGILTVVHFSLAVGFGPAIGSFLGRFLARNTSVGSVNGLIEGYGLSYGLFILTILSILALFYFGNRQQATGNRQQATGNRQQATGNRQQATGNRQQATGNRQQATFLIFVAACIPLLENIVMLQHATQFSFDRLKFIFPAALILAFSLARLETNGRIICSILILLSCFQGYKSYKADMSHYSSWGSIASENSHLVSRISDKVDMKCAVFSTNLNVRGYANFLFHRGIYENKSMQDTPELLSMQNACASVYVEGTLAFPDLPNYTKATITHSGGFTDIITSRESSANISDDNWSHGIAKRWAGFVVINLPENKLRLTPGRKIRFADGEVRVIANQNESGIYLNISLDGQPMDGTRSGYPNKFEVIE